MNSHWRLWILICVLLLSETSAAQTLASLKTSETELEFQAGPHAPRLSSLQSRTEILNNTIDEGLVSNIEVEGETFPIVWNFDAADSRRDSHLVQFIYEAASPPLRLTWEWEVRSQHGPVEHQIRIENRGNRELWIPLQSSLVFNWKVPPQDKLEQFYVEKGADSPSAVGTHRVQVPEGYRWEGTSSTYAQPRPGEAREIIPYFLVESTNRGQAGWYVGMEFSGRTQLTLARDGDSLHGAVGPNPNPGPFRTRLKPGETFETPRIFLGGSSGGPDWTANILRRWVREVLISKDTAKDPRYPFLVNNSWGGGMHVNDDIAHRMIRDSAELGFEMFHLDAGWFRGVGDWFPDPTKFPKGLRSIADEAHARGMKFGLWVDWTQAGLDTARGALNVRDPQVKSWLTVDLPESWKPEEFKGQPIDLGVPEAKAWAMRETDRIVTDYNLDMLEHDGYLVAKGCEAVDHRHAPPDPLNQCTYRDSGFVFVNSANSTDVSYHAVRSYYEIQANLHRNHPGLLLEVCNDGGRMVDFGSAAHGDYFSITDSYDPLSNRRAFYDASFVLPPAMLEAYVEHWPAPRIENFRYMLRSGMMGWLSVMIDTTSWTPPEHRAAKQELQLYKSELRPLIRSADLFHISQRPDGVHWDGMEYFDPQTRRGAVFAFRGSTQTEIEHQFILKGLSPASHYRLRFHDHSSADQVVVGGTLMKAGLRVHLPIADSSEIILLEEMASSLAKKDP